MSFFTDRFLAPAAEFSPKPMWFLNGDLTEAELTRQLEDFLAHGVKGVILHPRIGVPRSLPYMGERFLQLMRHAVSECARLGMHVILYDEGMYPSGSANGQVVRENPAFASRCLRMIPAEQPLSPQETVVARLLLTMDGDRLISARESDDAPTADERAVLLVSGYSHGTIRGIHPDQDDGQPDAPPSADILNPDAVDCFIRLTHDRYASVLGEWFGTVVTSVFCDEPDPLGRNAARDMRPWTPGLQDELYRVGLTLADLPALWLDMGERTAVIRGSYARLIGLRLGDAFYGRLQNWCHAHGLMLTGHPQRAEDLGLEQYFDIPGQDVVWRWVAPENDLSLRGGESTQAACAASAMLHQGKRRSSSECFGCCGPNGDQWTFHVEDQLFYLNWLFVRGCNCIYPHAFLYAADTRIRFGDRPPDVGPHNYWWPWYGQIADYISRMCAMLTDVEVQIPVAILSSDTHLPWQTAAFLQQWHVPYCYVTGQELSACNAAAGEIILPHDVRHSLLIVEETDLLAQPGVQGALARLAAAGVPVLHAWQCGFEQAAERVSVMVKLPFTMADGQDIRLLWRTHDDETLLLAVNEGDEPWHGSISVSEPCACTRLDPWSGEVSEQALDGDHLPVSLSYRQAMCFVFRKGVPARQGKPQRLPEWQPVSADFSWQAELPGGMADVSLGDWQQLPGMAMYTGSLTYHTAFELPDASGRFLLRLGEVREAAQVWVNDKEATVLLKHPYECELTGLCHAGRNELTVRVTGGVKSRFDQVPWPAGLFSPVQLLRVAQEQL